MKNLRMIVSYDGSDYHGFQIQPAQDTVQEELQKAVQALVGHTVQIFGSGRTDTGVHAREQVINFHTSSPIPVERWAMALNSRLPSDIVVHHVEEVDKAFHARYSAKRKTYRYTIKNSRYPDVFQRNYQWHISRTLDIGAMENAATCFVGTHEFTSFCSKNTSKVIHERTLYRSEWVREGDVLHYFVEGNGFLHHMVRIIVGTLIEVGDGKRTAESMKDLLHLKDRDASGPTAPPMGLMLWAVEYNLRY
jgi:tRNA pseudouridine38-40 synthase